MQFVVGDKVVDLMEGIMVDLREMDVVVVIMEVDLQEVDVEVEMVGEMKGKEEKVVD